MAADTMLYTLLASHVHALSLPQIPTCPPLGCNPSILINTCNDVDSHNALGFIPPHILHHHLLISDLIGGIIHSISSIMPW